jgi:monoamine oxidase
VVEIAVLESGRVQVVTDQLGDQQVQEFDFLIVALPNQAARRMKYRGDSLTRVMVEHQKCFDFPAHYLRITIAFREKFWQGKIQDSYCMLDRFGGCCLYDESCRNPGSPIPVLGWLISGSAAEELAAQSDDELLALALDSLPEFLQSGRNLVVEGKVHRWADAVNAIPGGLQPMSLDRRHRPLADHNLFVVGDYLFDSTLNGVLDSAEYTGMWIVSLMAERIGVAG